MDHKLQTTARIVSVKIVESNYAVTNAILARKMLDQETAKINVVNKIVQRKITNEIQHDFIIVKFC